LEAFDEKDSQFAFKKGAPTLFFEMRHFFLRYPPGIMDKIENKVNTGVTSVKTSAVSFIQSESTINFALCMPSSTESPWGRVNSLEQTMTKRTPVMTQLYCCLPHNYLYILV
jgi:hypothetical protein